MNRRYTIVRGAPAEAGSRRSGGVQPAGRPTTRSGGARASTRGLEVESTELGPRDVADVVRDPSVNAVAPTMPISLIRPRAASVESVSDGTWGLAAVGADDSDYDGSGVVVAVLDSGIDAGHPAFTGVSIEQRDFTGTGDGDQDGHGTHCAGTIFGRAVDGTRIGVAPGVTSVLVGKVLDASGFGDTDALYRGMQWALDRGARVISMSIGFDFPGFVAQLVEIEGLRVDVATSLALEGYRLNLRSFDAVMRFVEVRSEGADGAIVVAAAGNESGRDAERPYEIGVSIPAAASGVVSVGALGNGEHGYEIAAFSNTQPILSAPGVDITSAKAGGGLVATSGTSMATPHVAGIAALWWQAMSGRNLRLSARSVESSLRARATTEGFAPDASPDDFGEGMVTAP